MRPYFIYVPSVDVSGLPLTGKLIVLGVLVVILILAIFNEKIGYYYKRKFKKNKKY
jgi:hypothetical protein